MGGGAVRKKDERKRNFNARDRDPSYSVGASLEGHTGTRGCPVQSANVRSECGRGRMEIRPGNMGKGLRHLELGAGISLPK